jgi:hypothetical protein
MVALSLPTKDSRTIARKSIAIPSTRRVWATRIDGRSRLAQEIKRLVATYSAEIDRADNPLVSRRIRELAETEVLLASLRARALRGESIDPTAVPRYANLIARQRAALGLGAAPSDPWGDV